jgi:hypothetical protein
VGAAGGDGAKTVFAQPATPAATSPLYATDTIRLSTGTRREGVPETSTLGLSTTTGVRTLPSELAKDVSEPSRQMVSAGADSRLSTGD